MQPSVGQRLQAYLCIDSDSQRATVPTAEQRGFKWPTAPGWQHLACVKDDDKSPAWNFHNSFSDVAMTVEKCQEACARGGYNVAGLEPRGGQQCRCMNKENVLLSGGVAYANCNTPCPGNTSQLACGGSYLMNTFYMTPGTPNNYSSAYYKGCYAPYDGAVGVNTVTTYKFDSLTMTQAVCRDACLSKGATWMGLKYGRTCQCGTSLSWGTGSWVPDSQCSSDCLGETSTKCGSLNQFSMFNLTNSDVKASNSSKPLGWKGESFIWLCSI
jgi:hypothetical protein